MPCKFMSQTEPRELSPAVGAPNIKIDGDVKGVTAGSCFADAVMSEKHNGSCRNKRQLARIIFAQNFLTFKAEVN